MGRPHGVLMAAGVGRSMGATSCNAIPSCGIFPGNGATVAWGLASWIEGLPLRTRRVNACELVWELVVSVLSWPLAIMALMGVLAFTLFTVLKERSGRAGVKKGRP